MRLVAENTEQYGRTESAKTRIFRNSFRAHWEHVFPKKRMIPCTNVMLSGGVFVAVQQRFSNYWSDSRYTATTHACFVVQ